MTGTNWSTAPERRQGYPATPLGESRTCRVVSLHPLLHRPGSTLRTGSAAILRGHGLDTEPIVIATLLLLASPLGAGLAPSPPVATPIAVGHRYQLPATTAATRRAAALGTLACRPATRVLRMAHVELFVRGRAVLLPAGIGIAPPAAISAGRVLGGRCRYALSTADPTGLISVNQPGRRRLGQLFRIWGQPLGDRSEIVIELGRLIPPHSFYLFPEQA